MLTILGEILPPVTVLLSLMVLGLALGRAGVLTPEFNRGLGWLLLRVTLPCLIVVSMQKPFSPDLAVLGGWAWLVSFVLYAGLFLISAWVVPEGLVPGDRRGVYRFVLMFSNVGFMGFPLVEALWGRDAVFLAALFNINFNLFVFSVGVWVLTRHQEKDGFPWKEILFNPGLLATLLGLVLFLTSWALPPVVFKVADTIGGLTTPLSMLFVGCLLAQTSLRTVWKGKGIWLVTLARLILIPVGVWAALAPWGLPVEVTRLAVLVAAMPAAANTSLLAAEYTQTPELAGRAVFISTAVSFLTIPVLVVLLGLA